VGLEITGRSLANVGPFLITANVRGKCRVQEWSVGTGLGQVGDLVVGSVLMKPGQEIVILDQDRKAHKVTRPQRVLTVLGPRDSSTHVCAIIPPGGLQIKQGTMAYWVAGESGIVACLEREAPVNSIHAAENAIDFRLEGLVLNTHGQAVNIREFSVQPLQTNVSTPIVLVGATSSESGKTVLAGELIRRLSNRGHRVGALKVTGTGGVLDSLFHSKSGAVAVLDFVDAGLISTHCDAADFRKRIPLVFRQMETLGVDVIIAELGGDLLSANNPEVFALKELMDTTLMLLVISNDALAAAGVVAMNELRFGFPVSKIRHFTSPFRNHAGMARRMEMAGVAVCYDPRSANDIARIVDQVIGEMGS